LKVIIEKKSINTKFTKKAQGSQSFKIYFLCSKCLLCELCGSVKI
jgi:hypothetical protein